MRDLLLFRNSPRGGPSNSTIERGYGKFLLSATESAIVQVPNIYEKAGDRLLDLFNDRVEDQGKAERTEGIPLHTTATEDREIVCRFVPIPQLYNSPVAMTTNEHAPPAATVTTLTPLRPSTCVGRFGSSVSFPRPSRPYSLRPHVNTSPSQHTTV